MNQRSPAIGALSLLSPPSRCLWWMVELFLVLCLSLSLPGDATGRRGSCVDGYGDYSSLGFGWGNSDGRSSLRDICSVGLGPFCFPSTLTEDARRREGYNGHPGNGASFRMANGATVSCFLKASRDEIHEDERIASCKVPHVPDAWVGTSGGHSAALDEDSEEIERGVLYGSSSPHVDISPPVLDWGVNTLYSPSLASMKVANAYKDSVLHVYDLFSTNPQFYGYSFSKISVLPGQSASIDFVFLPRWLGLSSAHLIMQTNFGGFVIQARGVTIESPYKIEPLLDGSMNRNFSLYNPSASVLHVEEVAAWLSVSYKDTEDSVHVVCRLNASHQAPDVSMPLPGQSWVDLRPHKRWEVPPHSALTVVEMNLWPHLEGSVSGTICMKLQGSALSRADTVIVPIEVEAHGRELYRDLTGSLSVFLEPAVPCDGRESIFSLSARNEASYLLSVVKISVLKEGSELFQVDYMEGLILYPESVSRIAFVSYTPVDSHSNAFDLSLNCELSIVTNDSTSSGINIPCQNLFHTCSRYQPSSNIVISEDSYIGITTQQEKEKSANARTGSLGAILEETLHIKPKLLEVAKADELILRDWRSQGTMSDMSVIEDRELLFPAVQIGTHSSKWITVHNPSHKPVVMQLVLNSGVIVDQCKSEDDSSEHIFSSLSARIDSTETHDGFSLADSARTEAFVHPLGSALFGPLVFRPSKRCMWRSSALIRNNLSGVEWLPLRAFGGSHSLVLLEGSEPVRKLEFNLHPPTSINLSSWNLLPHTESAASSCGHLLSKELYAKNIGELTLEVLKMDVSGSTCGIGGFTIHECRGFALAPGESIKLVISYQADFSAAVVHRELELAMASGIFVLPMKAILPVYMLKLCRKSFYRSTLWNLSILALTAALLTCLVILRMIPHAASSRGTKYYFIKNDKAITTISTAAKPSRLYHNTKPSARSAVEDEKPEVNIVHCSTPRMQSRQELDHQKKTTVATKPVVLINSSEILETPHAADLTVRVVRERGRRRKRRAKFDVSSSQSGNSSSTPSSPLSPNASTLKQIWPLSTEAALVPETDSTLVTIKSTGRPTLLPSATFPSPSWRAPGVAVASFLTPTSPIAPHARAPGSKLGKGGAIRREEDSNMVVKDFTYDIWGNYFSDHLLGKPKEISSKVFHASEGDSRSFFAREPQSLMMMSSAHSVSPGRKFPPNNVDRIYEMD